MGLELYNHINTIRKIAKDARMSPRDIGVILNEIIEEKIEWSKKRRMRWYWEELQTVISLHSSIQTLFLTYESSK